MVPIFPLIYDYEKYKWEYINERIVSLCKKNNLIPISLLESYRRYNYNDMRVQRGDFTHPSVKGNRVAAESIAQSLLDRADH